MNLQFDLSLLSKYRTQLMGIAMLWVLWFHSGISTGLVLVDSIKSNGYAGVDVFLFLSGIGNYFSLKKDQNISRYYKRKLHRLLPIYIIAALLYTIVKVIVYNEPITVFFYEVSSLAVWENRGVFLYQGFGWYVPFLMLLYLITPFVMRFFEKRPFLVTLLIALVSILVSVLIVGTEFNCFAIMTIRVPVYFIGILFGYLISRKTVLTIRWILVSLLMFVVGVVLIWQFNRTTTPLDMWKYGFLWYPYILITAPLSLFLSYILSLFKEYRYPVLSFFGIYSLPIYLIHGWMPLMIAYLGIVQSRVFITLISITVSLIISYLIQNGVNKLMAKVVPGKE